MGKVLIEEENLTNIANSIRSKTGSTDTMTPGEMAENIDSIEAASDISEYFDTGTYTSTSDTSAGRWVTTIKKLPSLDIAGVSNLNYFYKNFRGETIDLNNLNTDSATTMYGFFSNCSNLTNLDLSKLNTGNVTNLGYMFNNCSKLTNLDLSKLNTGNVTSFRGMFYGCSNLTSVNLNNLNTSKLYDIDELFYTCGKLTSIDLTVLDLTNVNSITNVFNSCTNLTDIDLSTFNMEKVASTANAFKNVTMLTNLKFGYNFGKGFTQKSNNYYSLEITSYKMTHDSLMNVINNLYDLNLTCDVANGGTLYTQSLKLGSTNLAKLTADEIAIATNKGWTVS